MYAEMSADEAYERDEVSLAQIREDESWSDFYHGLEVEAEMEKDRDYQEAEADWYAAQEDW